MFYHDYDNRPGCFFYYYYSVLLFILPLQWEYENREHFHYSLKYKVEKIIMKLLASLFIRSYFPQFELSFDGFYRSLHITKVSTVS